MNLKSYLVKIFFSLLINALNYLLPKFKGREVFIGYPDYDDMLRGLTLVKPEGLIVLISSNSVKRPLWLPNNYKVINKKSLLGMYYLLTSTKVYFTHGIYQGFKALPRERQYLFNLWHGMPLKKIGKIDNNTIIQESHSILSTSEYFRGIISKAFGVLPSEVQVLGLPRNLLLENKQRSEELEYMFSSFKKIYLWLPTYRKSIKGDVRKDGDSDNILGSDDYCLKEINEKLSQDNCLLIIKPHPMAGYSSYEDNLSSIVIINEEWLVERSATLYQLMSYTDLLITDYSSVIFDYMITNKKILLTNNDVEQYHGNRGFIFSPEEIGLPTVSNTGALIEALRGDLEQNDYVLPNRYMNCQPYKD